MADEREILTYDQFGGAVRELAQMVVDDGHQAYVWRRTEAWIDFPWSSLPPVTRSR
ncbi:MAG: hypothetical protein Q7J48_14090 [Nocardioides sp.]|nr:hypothetical protein [Nocardioides sp.]